MSEPFIATLRLFSYQSIEKFQDDIYQSQYAWYIRIIGLQIYYLFLYQMGLFYAIMIILSQKSHFVGLTFQKLAVVSAMLRGGLQIDFGGFE